MHTLHRLISDRRVQLGTVSLLTGVLLTHAYRRLAQEWDNGSYPHLVQRILPKGRWYRDRHFVCVEPASVGADYAILRHRDTKRYYPAVERMWLWRDATCEHRDDASERFWLGCLGSSAVLLPKATDAGGRTLPPSGFETLAEAREDIRDHKHAVLDQLTKRWLGAGVLPDALSRVPLPADPFASPEPAFHAQREEIRGGPAMPPLFEQQRSSTWEITSARPKPTRRQRKP